MVFGLLPFVGYDPERLFQVARGLFAIGAGETDRVDGDLAGGLDDNFDGSFHLDSSDR